MQSQKDRLDNLFKKASAMDDAEMQAHFARYLCVLVSGFLENAIREIYSTYARGQSSPYAANYVNAQLKHPGNPNMERVHENQCRHSIHSGSE
ncbi:MAG: hypothetical protein HC828_17695 [Blastochloris sp.]|nr:hypothetical protein [Blastochloris sp.]